jgi:proline-specific peptidase
MPHFIFDYLNSVTITTFYKTVGDIHSSPPLIFLHGGPGAGCEDQYPLAEPLAAAGIPSIHYDQVGCGRSSRLREKAEEPSFWTFDLFCAQLDRLIDDLGVREKGFFLHGQSWGGMLASTYSARRPKGLRRLVVANSPSSAAVFEREILPLFKALPVSEEVLRLDMEERYRDPVYEEALARFAKKHFCLLDPWPDVLDGTVCKESTNMVLM